MVERAIGPCEPVENCPGGRCRGSLQGDLFQHRVATSFAFLAELLRGIFKRLEDGRIGGYLGVACGFEPCRKCLRASCEASRGLPAPNGRWNLCQIVMKLREMIQGVGEPDETGLECAQIGGLQR